MKSTNIILIVGFLFLGLIILFVNGFFERTTPQDDFDRNLEELNDLLGR